MLAIQREDLLAPLLFGLRVEARRKIFRIVTELVRVGTQQELTVPKNSTQSSLRSSEDLVIVVGGQIFVSAQTSASFTGVSDMR